MRKIVTSLFFGIALLMTKLLDVQVLFQGIRLFLQADRLLPRISQNAAHKFSKMVDLLPGRGVILFGNKRLNAGEGIENKMRVHLQLQGFLFELQQAVFHF